MSSTDPESNRLLDLRKVVILLVGLAMATGAARFAHLRVKGENDSLHIFDEDALIHEALGLPPDSVGWSAELTLKDVEERPELRRFVDGLSERLRPLIPGEGFRYGAWAISSAPSQGWPLASRLPAYDIACVWCLDGSSQFEGTHLWADRNGLDPFSLLGFVGNVFIHAIPLTLLVAGLWWWVRSWRAKQRARRRGFPVVPLDGEA